MGVRTLRDKYIAAMYCSTTDWAFGPIFFDTDSHNADERIESFLRWLKSDPRHYSEKGLETKYAEWRHQENAQWAREEKEEDDRYNKETN